MSNHSASMDCGGQAEQSVYPTYLRVRSALYKTTAEIRQALADIGRKLDEYVSVILDRLVLELDEEEYELVCVSGHELGFGQKASIREICDRARTFGLIPCTQETVFLAILQSPDYLEGKHIYFVSEPMEHRGRLHIFFIIERHSEVAGGQWVHTNYGEPGAKYETSVKWAFVRAKEF